MDDTFVLRRPRRRAPEITNLHHYRVELFYTVIDMQLQELNNRFNKVNTELLLCVACLNPSDSFCAFDKQKLIRLAQFYPFEFSTIDLLALENQVENYIVDTRSDEIRSFRTKRYWQPSKKVSRDKEKYCISTSLFACRVVIDSTSHNCNSGKSFFCNEIRKEPIA
jgi:hypothetical protein